MKLATFASRSAPDQPPRIGALLSDKKTLLDLAEGYRAMTGTSRAWCSDMLGWFDGGSEAADETRRLLEYAERERPRHILHELNNVVLLAPVPRPRSIRDCMAFERHLIQAIRGALRLRRSSRWLAVLDQTIERYFGRGLIRPPRVWREQPVYYKGNPLSVVGPEAEIRWPTSTSRLDYELEFGIFIGRQGRDIPEGRAKDYIAGYTIFNDFSARDVQLREMAARLGPAKGKDFDTGNVMGPYLVTPDEVPDPYVLAMTVRVNGEVWSTGNSRAMTHHFERILAHISRDETVFPGEVIGSGTVGGGCGLEIGRWIQIGDVVELEVERLGVLRNRIVASNATSSSLQMKRST